MTDQLRSRIAGNLIEPDDAGYDEARRVWNAMIDKRPRLIVRAAGISDIAPTIAYAQESGLPLAIRGGGHNVAGNGTVDGGVLLDLGRLRTVEVDPATRLVRVGAGATLADVDAATQAHGLAVPIGVVSGTGIAGLTLGGGVGWLARKYGLAIDNLVDATVVLANGETVTASAKDHPDLFWGLRGGGGNFGVVTSFTFRAHPLGPDVFAGSLVYERDHWHGALTAYARWTADVPDELSTIVTFMVPPADWEMGDKVLMFLGFAWAGADRAAGEAAIDRFTSAAPPDVAVTDPTTWQTFQSGFDAAMPKGSRAYWRNAWFERLDGPVLDAIAEHCAEQAWVGTAVDLHHMGGAFGRVAEDATAFPDRSAGYWLNIYGFWIDQDLDETRTAWVKDFSEAIGPLAMSTSYVNFMGQDDAPAASKALAVYGPDKLQRLREVKRTYDPNNVFRVNHNIPPAE
jgi:FAD/FMN-containing dehydrogenase